MKKAYILLISLLIAFVTGCQDHNLEPHPEDVMAWRAGGAAFDQGEHIATDQSGNVYVAGYFTQSATFGSQSLTSPAGGVTIFIAKYSPTGEILWVQQPTATNSSSIGGMTVDANGNVYLTGSFRGRITIGSVILTSRGGADVFTVKLNSSGEAQWGRNEGGSSDSPIPSESGTGIAADEVGHVYVTGYFHGSTTLGATAFTSSGESDIFVMMYNSNGDVQWAQKAGGTGSDQGSDIAIDESGTIYVAGTFSRTATFGTVSLSPPTSSVSEDIFVAKYSNSGEALWARNAGGFRTDYVHGITVDKAGNIYVTGSFRDTFSIGSTTLQAGLATFDAFLAKFSNSGEVQWAQNIGGGYENINSDDGGHDITVDETGNVYVTGFIRGTPVHFGATPPALSDPQVTLSSKGSDDVFIARYGSDGKVHWARNEGGTDSEVGQGIAVDRSGTVYVTGSFQGTATFGTTILNSAGSEDVFVAKFKQ